MYLYIAFFNQRNLSSGQHRIYGDGLKLVKDVFPNYLDLDPSSIKGSIGYLKGRENGDKNVALLNISKVEASEEELYLEFDIIKELDLSNDLINKSLYRFAWTADWIDREKRYFPFVCIMDKLSFDTIRKGIPNLNKSSSHSAEIQELRSKNDWRGICNKFEPIEAIEKNEELWNTPSDLYNIAFASSKLGEPENGKERDRAHLNEVRKYREASISLYERCHELDPTNSLYASALGYRHYLNVVELTKQRGRRDGDARKEIEKALKWLNHAIELNPSSIKDNYRKGKLIIDRGKESMEGEGIASFERVIEIYENLTEERYKDYLLGEYIKSLYSLGSFYLNKARAYWGGYICSKIGKQPINYYPNKERLYMLLKSKAYLEKCFEVETDIVLDRDMKTDQLIKALRQWKLSPVDKLYRLGLVNIEVYFLLHMESKDLQSIKGYGDDGEAFLLLARNVAYEGKRRNLFGRGTQYINEKLAKYYIISNRYSEAIKEVENSRQAYMKNTYAMALLLSEDADGLNRAIRVLEGLKEDRGNVDRELSMALLIYAYGQVGEEGKVKELNRQAAGLNISRVNYFMERLAIGGVRHES